jgi:hypothetical protein
MQELDNILAAATAAIDNSYFSLPIDGGPSVSRERVYCYELYHQLRSRWPEQTPFLLNGEVDKRSHPNAELRRLALKPDLLVHGPGFMSHNHAIIEVKPTPIKKVPAQKDLRSLSNFKNQVGYQRGIFLIYGRGANERLIAHIRNYALEIEGTRGIEIWLHAAVGQPAIRACEVGIS